MFSGLVCVGLLGGCGAPGGSTASGGDRDGPQPKAGSRDGVTSLHLAEMHFTWRARQVKCADTRFTWERWDVRGGGSRASCVADATTGPPDAVRGGCKRVRETVS